MNRRDRKKEQTRSKLLEAALTQFGKRGIYSTRIEDITETADVAKGAFYNYFSSKHVLVAELLCQGIELLEVTFFNRIDAGLTVGQRVRALVEQQVAFWQQHPEYALLFHQARGWLLMEPCEPELKNALWKYLDCIARNLTGGDAPGGVPPERLFQCAVALAGLISGYRSFAFAVGLEMDLEFAVQIAVASIPSQCQETGEAGVVHGRTG